MTFQMSMAEKAVKDFANDWKAVYGDAAMAGWQNEVRMITDLSAIESIFPFIMLNYREIPEYIDISMFSGICFIS